MLSATQMMCGGMALTILMLATSLNAAEPKAEDLVKASFLADTTTAQPGQTFTVGVRLKISPHWHVYWSNSGDAGIPTTVEFKLPPGFTASPLQYPVPIRIEQSGNIVMYGYSDEVMLLAKITAPAQIESSNVTIEGSLNYLVCDENTCIPGDAKIKLSLPIGAQAKPNQPELFKSWNARIPIPAMQSDRIADAQAKTSIRPSEGPKSAGEISIVIHWKSTLPPTNIEWFPPARDGVQFGKQQIQSSGSTTTITIPFEHFGQPKPDEKPVDSVIAFTGAEGRSGLAVPITTSNASR